MTHPFIYSAFGQHLLVSLRTKPFARNSFTEDDPGKAEVGLELDLNEQLKFQERRGGNVVREREGHQQRLRETSQPGGF